MARPVVERSQALGVELDLARTTTSAGAPGTEVALSQPPAAPGGRPLRRAWRPVVVFGDAFSLEVSFAIGALARQPLGYTNGPSFGLSMQHERLAHRVTLAGKRSIQWQAISSRRHTHTSGSFLT